MGQFCTFYLGDHFFGVPVAHVQEVIRHQEMTRIPLAQREVRGLINLRGQIVTALDLRQCLGLDPRDPEARPMNVVVRTEEGPLSCLVDVIGDVLTVDDELFEEAPDTIEGIGSELIHGCYKLENQLLLILDVAKAIGVGSLC